MKEIVVIPKEHIEYRQILGAGFDTIRFHLGTDKTLDVPETFEELKELCKKLEPKLVKENSLYETQITLNINKCGYYAFYPDGTIIFKASNSINYTIAKNRTMLQMFQFIKSLIGEE